MAEASSAAVPGSPTAHEASALEGHVPCNGRRADDWVARVALSTAPAPRGVGGDLKQDQARSVSAPQPDPRAGKQQAPHRPSLLPMAGGQAVDFRTGWA